MANSAFKIYPNPCNDFLKVTNSINASVNTCFITDIHGRILISKTLENQQDLDVSELNSGIYFFSADREMKTHIKFVKE